MGGIQMEATDRLYRMLGQFIKSARVRQHLTQEELAAQVGLTRTSVNNIEHGRQRIQIHTLYAFADALRMRPAALLPRAPHLASQMTDERLDAALDEDYQEGEREWIRMILTDTDEGEDDDSDEREERKERKEVTDDGI